ncbi:hypothetical protein [Lentzea sp. NPDC051838]|uniref:hypothetical protein n=1 Tax=Lentzea sp. NPDC051838 TaxID=3154849 RepID=UPI00343F8C2B
MDFDLDDEGTSFGDEDGISGRSRRGKQSKARWSTAHYLGLAVFVFALVCIVYAVVAELAF